MQVQHAINTIKKNYRCRRNSKLKTLCNLSYKIEFNVLHSNNVTDSFLTLFRKKVNREHRFSTAIQKKKKKKLGN